MKMKSLMGCAVGILMLTYSGIASAVPVNLFLGDDSTVNVSLGFTFNFFGINYTDIWVNSNGNITFGSGETFWIESVNNFLDGPPMIAGVWDDLDPSNGGAVITTGDTTYRTISWLIVPEFIGTGSNTFSITLENTGDIYINFDELALTDGIVGISDGLGGADPGGTDFSSAVGPFSNTVTQYQHFPGFPDEFDLDNTSLHFTGAPIPEPATMLLFGTGLAGLIGSRIRRKK